MQNLERVGNLASGICRWLLLVFALILAMSAPSLAQTFTVLHAFTADDGSSPFAGVTIDRAGNLYGTTKYGGVGNCDLNCGVVFRLSPQASGWNFVPLYKFTNRSDGYAPVARIVFGPEGRLYGTTLLGGNSMVSGGTVFSLSPPPTACRSGSCDWVKTTLWSFGQNQDENDGLRPGYGDLVFDSSGHIYGTTEEGGTTRQLCGPGCGTVYMLSRAQRSWNETLIYEFGNGPGYHPYSGVTFDSNGNLYGTAPFGGTTGDGLVYELTSSSNGSWSPAILYNFSMPTDGGVPNAGLVSDSAGNLYGATGSGGSGGGGTIFELSPMAPGWNFQVLHSFDSPAHPFASLTMDAAGNLYGTTRDGGLLSHGNVFKLTQTNGSWMYTSLYDFTGGSDGGSPYGTVALDASGNLYGTATEGGSDNDQCSFMHGCGVVWQLRP